MSSLMDVSTFSATVVSVTRQPRSLLSSRLTLWITHVSWRRVHGSRSWKLVLQRPAVSMTVLNFVLVVTNGRSRASDRIYEMTRIVDKVVHCVCRESSNSVILGMNRAATRHGGGTMWTAFSAATYFFIFLDTPSDRPSVPPRQGAVTKVVKIGNKNKYFSFQHHRIPF